MGVSASWRLHPIQAFSGEWWASLRDDSRWQKLKECGHFAAFYLWKDQAWLFIEWGTIMISHKVISVWAGMEIQWVGFVCRMNLCGALMLFTRMRGFPLVIAWCPPKCETIINWTGQTTQWKTLLKVSLGTQWGLPGIVIIITSLQQDLLLNTRWKSNTHYQT